MEMGAYEAKTHFSELLEKVSQGEKVIITKHGHPIALLISAGQKTNTAAEAIAAIKRLRKGIKSKKGRIKDLITEGRL